MPAFAAFPHDGFRERLAFNFNCLEPVKLVIRFIASGNVTDAVSSGLPPALNQR